MAQLTCTIDVLRDTKRSCRLAARPSAISSRCYRIGPVEVMLTSRVPGALESYHELYGSWEVSRVHPTAFHIEVIARRSWRTGLRHYHILADGREEFTVRHRQQILSHIEAAINLQIVRHIPDVLSFHAAVVSKGDVALVMPGAPGSGKTTTATELLRRGWSYFSDEFALIDPDTLELQPYPKALSIKSGAYALLRRRIGVLQQISGHPRGTKGFLRCLRPQLIREDIVASPQRPSLILFPTYEPGATPAMEPISRARAAFEMTRFCFNLFKFRRRAVDILAEVVRPARCAQLRCGDLDATCDLIEAWADATGKTRTSEHAARRADPPQSINACSYGHATRVKESC